MTTNKQKRAEGPRCPACENEKTYLQSYFLTLYFKAIFLSEIK